MRMKTYFGKIVSFAAIFGCAVFLGCASAPNAPSFEPMNPSIANAVGIGPYVSSEGTRGLTRAERQQLQSPFQFHISYGIRLTLPTDRERAVALAIVDGVLIREEDLHQDVIDISPGTLGVVPEYYRERNPQFTADTRDGPRMATRPYRETSEQGFRYVIYVSFEMYTVGRRGPFDLFGSGEVMEPTLRFQTRWNPVQNDRFYLAFADDELGRTLYGPRGRTTEFDVVLLSQDGQTRQITAANRPHLNIRVEDIFRQTEDSRRVRGRTI